MNAFSNLDKIFEKINSKDAPKVIGLLALLFAFYRLADVVGSLIKSE